MSFSALVWTSLGDYSRWKDVWSGYLAPRWAGSSPAPYIGFDLYNCQYFQLPLVRGTSDVSSSPQQGDGLDTGYFYAVHTITGAITDMILFHQGGRPADVGTLRPWYLELDPKLLFGLLEPANTGGSYSDAKFVTGFIKASGGGSAIASRPHLFFWGTTPSSNVIYHYSPYAWKGAPSLVIVDIAMKAGLPASLFAQGAHSGADTAYTGGASADAPWLGWSSASGSTYYTIAISRRVGEKVIDTILEAARHTRDMYFIDETGKFSVSSFTSPYEVAGLTLRDGVTAVQWEWSHRWICNHVYATYGSAVKQWGDVSVAPDGGGYSPPGAVEEELLASYLGSDFVHEHNVAISEAQYGTQWLRGRDFITDQYGTPRTVTRAHYPCILEAATHGHGKIPVATYWMSSDSKPRRFITVTQDLRGLDYRLGDKLTGVELTCDGETIDDARCIGRSINYDTLTVTSILAEVPSNA